MPIDPLAKGFIDSLTAMGGPKLHEMSVADARLAIGALAQMSGTVDVPLASVIDRRIPGPAGEIPVRVYTPIGNGPFPLLVFFHGGGWVIGDLDSIDPVCRELARGADCVVLSVDYRLAPENKFPAGPEDCYAALCWAAANAASLGADANRIALGGDSAGGNLTCVTALEARDRGGPPLRFQLAIYPATDAACASASHRENGEGYLLDAAAMKWFWGHYLRSSADIPDPRVSPLRAANLAGLPPALVITAEFDPLRDEGEEYARRMQAAGVPVTISRYDGMIHGFYGMFAILPQARQAIAESCAALRAALG